MLLEEGYIMQKSFVKDYLIKNCFDSCFNMFVSDVSCDLKISNKEYSNLLEQEEKILTDFPKLRRVIEDGAVFLLNKEEVENLNHLFNILQVQNQIVMREIFIRGLTESLKL